MKLGSIFEQIAEACLVVDSTGRIIFANESAAQLLGHPIKELYGQPVPEDSPEGLPIRQTCQSAVSASQPVRVRHFSPKFQRWFEVRANPSAEDVVVFCLESSCGPGETNALLEQQLERQASELAEAIRELDSLSYTVSHDLRAPLRHIEAFAGLLEQNLAGKTDASTAEYVGIVAQSAKQMSVLLDGVLAYSRLCRRDVNRGSVKLNDVLTAVLQELKLETEGREIEWIIDPLPEVEADPWMLRQCLSQLISNALKFTRTRRPARIGISSLDGGDEVILRVEDNGIGFDMQNVDRVFGLFQKLHSDPAYEGAGIGLAHVRRMVNRQGGRTWAESKPDAGAIFFVALPKPRSSR